MNLINKEHYSIQETHCGSVRLFIDKIMFNTDINRIQFEQYNYSLIDKHFNKEKYILNNLSCWGGVDKEDDRSYSWEFNLSVEAVNSIVCKLFPSIH